MNVHGSAYTGGAYGSVYGQYPGVYGPLSTDQQAPAMQPVDEMYGFPPLVKQIYSAFYNILGPPPRNIDQSLKRPWFAKDERRILQSMWESWQGGNFELNEMFVVDVTTFGGYLRKIFPIQEWNKFVQDNGIHAIGERLYWVEWHFEPHVLPDKVARAMGRKEGDGERTQRTVTGSSHGVHFTMPLGFMLNEEGLRLYAKKTERNNESVAMTMDFKTQQALYIKTLDFFWSFTDKQELPVKLSRYQFLKKGQYYNSRWACVQKGAKPFRKLEEEAVEKLRERLGPDERPDICIGTKGQLQYIQMSRWENYFPGITGDGREIKPSDVDTQGSHVTPVWKVQYFESRSYPGPNGDLVDWFIGDYTVSSKFWSSNQNEDRAGNYNDYESRDRNILVTCAEQNKDVAITVLKMLEHCGLWEQDEKTGRWIHGQLGQALMKNCLSYKKKKDDLANIRGLRAEDYSTYRVPAANSVFDASARPENVLNRLNREAEKETDNYNVYTLMKTADMLDAVVGLFQRMKPSIYKKFSDIADSSRDEDRKNAARRNNLNHLPGFMARDSRIPPRNSGSGSSRGDDDRKGGGRVSGDLDKKLHIDLPIPNDPKYPPPIRVPNEGEIVLHGPDARSLKYSMQLLKVAKNFMEGNDVTDLTGLKLDIQNVYKFSRAEAMSTDGKWSESVVKRMVHDLDYAMIMNYIIGLQADEASSEAAYDSFGEAEKKMIKTTATLSRWSGRENELGNARPRFRVEFKNAFGEAKDDAEEWQRQYTQLINRHRQNVLTLAIGCESVVYGPRFEELAQIAGVSAVNESMWMSNWSRVTDLHHSVDVKVRLAKELLFEYKRVLGSETTPEEQSAVTQKTADWLRGTFLAQPNDSQSALNSEILITSFKKALVKPVVSVGSSGADYEGVREYYRSETDVIKMMKDINLAKFEFFTTSYRHDIPIPFSFEILRMFMQFKVASMVWLKKGDKTAVSLIKDASITFSRDHSDWEILFDTRFTFTFAIRDNKRLHFTPNTMSLGYIRGGGTTFFNPSILGHRTFRSGHRTMDCPDMFCYVQPNTFDVERPQFTTTDGTMQNDIYISDTPNEILTPNGPIYGRFWDHKKDGAAHIFSSLRSIQYNPFRAHIAWQGSQWVRDLSNSGSNITKKKTGWRHIDGCDELGAFVSPQVMNIYKNLTAQHIDRLPVGLERTS